MKKHWLLKQTKVQKEGHNYRENIFQTKYNTATIKASTAHV